jgi:CubicO group peptidase (beta-lactamase class C family)
VIGEVLPRDGVPRALRGADQAVPWWSCTKIALAAAALALVRDGALGLDRPAHGGPFTLRQLLRHEAGLTDYGRLDGYHAAVAAGEAPWPVSEMLRRADADRLLYPPGQGWGYSNIGYLYVTELIEAAADEDLQSALRRLVLAPLGIGHTRLATAPGDLQGVWMGEGETYDPGWVYHGLLVGPLRDAATLLDRLMRGELFPEAFLREMCDARPLPGVPVNALDTGRPWLDPAYGLGVMIGHTADGASWVGHTGAGPGSVIAVYHCAARATTVAAVGPGDDQGRVEREALGLARSA